MEVVAGKTFVTRPDRHSVSLSGFALSATRDSDIQLCDMSYGGCGMICADKFKAGELVELRIVRRGAVQAEIRWTAKGRAGAQFLG